jgi:hypothetical protein
MLNGAGSISPTAGPRRRISPVGSRPLKRLASYEYIRKSWTLEPERSILDPIQQMPGLNSLRMPKDRAPLCSRHMRPSRTPPGQR